ncbi:unnamed protein product [Prorocentrum cordatum]|uniref:Ion transport domain-containing protein n=1 Tax=Prorocentrum cordatum TaxID=2364126 RepID=A0ABN9VZX6_9DINO|nr:unnamed protein product [Polarella glacialis]
MATQEASPLLSGPSPGASSSEDLMNKQMSALEKKRYLRMQSLEADYREKGYATNCFWKYKLQVAEFYNTDATQWIVAGLIISNFVAQCIQRVIDPCMGGEPDLEHHGNIWKMVSNFFNVIFLIELMINLYGCWLCPTWIKDSWNQFDCVVVALGVVDLCGFDYPGQLRLLRMLRVFRIFRLFARFEGLQQIVFCLSASLPDVGSAAMIMVMIMCIFAVLAVDIFSGVYSGEASDSDKCTYDSGDYGICLAQCTENESVGITPRGHCWGYEYYGTFGKAFYTLFQITTGESWSEAGIRPALMFFRGDGVVIKLVLMLLVFMYVIVTSWIMLNVVVTVLLDKFSSFDSASTSDAPKPPKDLRDAFDQMKASVDKDMDTLQATIEGLVEELNKKKKW